RAVLLQYYYNTMSPACLWYISRKKRNHKFRNRAGQILLIDARKLGTMIDRTHKELTDEDVKNISNTYHSWRGELKDIKYADVQGFCKSSSIEEIGKYDWVLTPGRYVGAEEVNEDSD